MKASELKNYLNEIVTDKYDPEIEIEIKRPCCGGTPCVFVKSCGVGFDWDHGRLILVPEKDLICKDNKNI
jgi:hypothetical protein